MGKVTEIAKISDRITVIKFLVPENVIPIILVYVPH